MTTSSHPFGFHMPGPMPAPVPLRQVPALQTTDAPAVPASTVVGATEPLFPMCATCGNKRGPWTPRGQERYRSGAQVLVCKDGCEITPVQAATGVIAAAMTSGAGTPREWAQAEEDAGLLFDPKRAKDIAAAAAEQARAEMRVELNQACEDRQSLDWFHSRYRAVGRLCEGRHPTDCLTLAEVLTAIDGKASDAPLTITWDRVVAAPGGDHLGQSTLVGCTTARGGTAVLALDDDQRADLAEKLLAAVHPAEACATPGCGMPDQDLDPADPPVRGSVLIDVAGTDGGPHWWCTPSCAAAAIAAAGAELRAADHLAAIDPAQQAPEVVYGGDPGRFVDEVACCHRCGCTEDRACQGGCRRIPNAQHIRLCSACATPQELAYAAAAPQGGWGAAS